VPKSGDIRSRSARRLADHFPATGNFLFRWRSYLPLVLVPVFLPSFLGLGYPFGSHAAGFAWEIGCFAISSLGVVIRLLTVGTSPRGTSGRNTRGQKAVVLNTTGLYSVVRHPLYLANYLVGLGMSLFSRTWYLPLIVSLATLLYYERIAAREEEFLEERFGEEFRRWAARVPAMLPRFSNYQPAAIPFDWRRALRREFYVVVEMTTVFFVLDIVEDFSVHGRLEIDPIWATVAIAGALSFATIWTLKKTGRLGP
jgi:protein-S-isoprenylcysteine O-methyltransferase Ste14